MAKIAAKLLEPIIQKHGDIMGELSKKAHAEWRRTFESHLEFSIEEALGRLEADELMAEIVDCETRLQAARKQLSLRLYGSNGAMEFSARELQGARLRGNVLAQTHTASNLFEALKAALPPMLAREVLDVLNDRGVAVDGTAPLPNFRGNITVADLQALGDDVDQMTALLDAERTAALTIFAQFQPKKETPA